LFKLYDRQPHITLFVCGFLTDAPRYDDDYSQEQFRLHAASLGDAGISSFSIEIGRLNSFASAPYLEIRDSDKGIERVRTVLSRSMDEVGRTTYTPHLTVGLYAGAFPSAVVLERISSFPRTPVVIKSDRIIFATYEARATAGALTSYYELALPQR
jgi:2'-5' RNA ligase